MKLRSLAGLGLVVAGVAAAGVGCNGHTALGEDGTAGSDGDDSGSAGKGGKNGTAGNSSAGKSPYDPGGNDAGGNFGVAGTVGDFGGTYTETAGTSYGGYSTAGTFGDFGGTYTETAGTSYGGYSTAGNSSAGSSGGPPATLDLTEPAGTCAATCEDGATSLYNLNTLEDFYSHLVGRWLICSGGANTFQKPANTIGVEFAAPTLVDSPYGGKIWQGNMYYLVAGNDGPERGKGLQYLLTYDVSPQNGGFLSRLNMHSAPTSVIPAMFKYSACPRQWLITGEAAQDAGALLVPVE
jgi:hypothetical protein